MRSENTARCFREKKRKKKRIKEHMLLNSCKIRTSDLHWTKSSTKEGCGCGFFKYTRDSSCNQRRQFNRGIHDKNSTTELACLPKNEFVFQHSEMPRAQPFKRLTSFCQQLDWMDGRPRYMRTFQENETDPDVRNTHHLLNVRRQTSVQKTPEAW